ncbi:MAG: 1-acyl-sn-glycerol-3-phosphate acyltransferase [Nitrospinae bacterium]|nr:1-acyl-sn-glycerol-3-phosphate acyltransferase [Nitrospinota bacterium]
MGSIAIILSIPCRNINIVHSVARLWGRGICRLTGVTVEVRGIENILWDRSQIFISNHQGMYDIFALEGYMPLRFLWVAKESLFRIPVIGLVMKRAGYIGINRSSPKRFLKSLNHAVEEIKSGRSVIIFPEGTRSRDGSIGRFKKGSLFLISKTGAPVVPVAISGSFNVMRRGEFRIRPGKVSIFIDKPIEVKEISRSQEGQFMETLRDIIVKNFQKLESDRMQLRG